MRKSFVKSFKTKLIACIYAKNLNLKDQQETEMKQIFVKEL